MSPDVIVLRNYPGKEDSGDFVMFPYGGGEFSLGDYLEIEVRGPYFTTSCNGVYCDLLPVRVLFSAIPEAFDSHLAFATRIQRIDLDVLGLGKRAGQRLKVKSSPQDTLIHHEREVVRWYSMDFSDLEPAT